MSSAKRAFGHDAATRGQRGGQALIHLGSESLSAESQSVEREAAR